MKREELFIFADEIAQRLCISKAFAYKLMQQMNKELQKQGFITIHGRVSRAYFEEHFYGMSSK